MWGGCGVGEQRGDAVSPSAKKLLAVELERERLWRPNPVGCNERREGWTRVKGCSGDTWGPADGGHGEETSRESRLSSSEHRLSVTK